jgi:SAM-dependent methyltransferase
VVREELSFSSNVPTAYSRVTIQGKGAAGMSDTFTKETERIRRIWEKQAPSYDRNAALWEKILFEDGRRWVCSRTHGEVLEVAIGTGLNLAFYPEAVVRLTGVDLSPAMLEIARQRARKLGIEVDLREGMPKAYRSRMNRSTPSFAPCLCATYLTTAGPSPR